MRSELINGSKSNKNKHNNYKKMTWWQKKLGIIIVVVTIHQWWSFILMTPGSLLQCGSLLKGMLSIWKPPCTKPLISFGHDECIFKQFLMTNKSWIGPNGETAPVPKDDGAGLMISAFWSRKFGFGLPLTEEQLNGENKHREGKMYVDEEAAIATWQSKVKRPLTTSPFIQEFEYGQSNQRYWMYRLMVCQLDDCIDVLNVLFGQ